MRLTEYIDLITRKDLPGKDEYSHLEIYEEVEDKFGNKKIKLKDRYKKARKDYKNAE
tara:strand:+ start:304 stop:474 length:171 start_codon:yes stop_codon:yes gene_type:complete